MRIIIKQKRCPNGTRKNKQGECVKKNVVAKEKSASNMARRKRCPNGTRKNKQGDCIKKIDNNDKINKKIELKNLSKGNSHSQSKKSTSKKSTMEPEQRRIEIIEYGFRGKFDTNWMYIMDPNNAHYRDIPEKQRHTISIGDKSAEKIPDTIYVIYQKHNKDGVILDPELLDISLETGKNVITGDRYFDSIKEAKTFAKQNKIKNGTYFIAKVIESHVRPKIRL